jgi:hypothetical protein
VLLSFRDLSSDTSGPAVLEVGPPLIDDSNSDSMFDWTAGLEIRDSVGDGN